MASNDDIDLLVEGAVKKIRESGGQANARSVRAELKINMLDVCRAFKRFTDKEKIENEAKVKNAISLGIGAEILKDREAFAAAKTEILEIEVTQLEIACEMISEEVVELQTKLDDLQVQITSERVDHAEKSQILEHSNSHLNGILQSMQGQLDTLKNELAIERKKRDDATKKHSGLRETLLLRNAEMKVAQSEANSLRRQLGATTADRDKASCAREVSEKATERLQGQVTELTSQAEHLRKALLSETQLRIDAEKLCFAATQSADTYQPELAALSKKAPRARKKV
jgi:chromosome segregation ATPase